MYGSAQTARIFYVWSNNQPLRCLTTALAMASAESNKNGHAYMAACDRVLHHVVALVHAKGLLEVSLDIDPGRAPFEVITGTHEIHLRQGNSNRTVSVDHETFMNEALFKALVLHRLKAAIDELASGASTPSE